MARFPCIVDLDKQEKIDRDAFLPKAQFDLNPSVSCNRLSHELTTLKDLINHPSKKITDNLAQLQRPKLRDSHSKPALPRIQLLGHAQQHVGPEDFALREREAEEPLVQRGLGTAAGRAVAADQLFEESVQLRLDDRPQSRHEAARATRAALGVGRRAAGRAGRGGRAALGASRGERRGQERRG